jgi:SAM-dependent methyltransferase
VLDVGIGTGLSALPFREAGADVVGVDVDARMAELARSRGFEVEVARFEQWDPAGRVFDAVVAGQTWHWVDPVAGSAKAAAVLRPGGRLAVFWNVGDPDPDVAAGFAEVYRAVDTGLPFTPWSTPMLSAYEHMLTAAAEGIRAAGAFAEPERLRFDWQSVVTREAWLDQVPTAGGHNRIPPDRLAALLEGLGRVVDEHGASFTMQYATLAVTALNGSSPSHGTIPLRTRSRAHRRRLRPHSAARIAPLTAVSHTLPTGLGDVRAAGTAANAT